jgi:hypothetical protein
MNTSAHPHDGAPPALVAFLRGSGRRALLFAEWQGGDRVRGDAAALANLRSFAADAALQPMAQWPRRFWAGLLAEPGLRPGAGAAAWPPGMAMLAQAGPGSRAALLLWLVAGLGEEEAAAALGVAAPAWRLALRRAAPHAADGQIDEGAWRALEAEVRDALRALSPERLHAWEAACDATALAPPPQPVFARPRAARVRPRWLWPVLAVGAATVVALVLVSWHRLPAIPGLAGGAAGTAAVGPVQRTPLPAAGSPPAFDPDDEAALLLHPDFEQLLAAGDEAYVRDLAFNAWYAAQRAGEGGKEDPDATP